MNSDKIIYHYCDIDALVSIVSNQQLWMTAHTFLNDENEYLEGLNLLVREIQQIKQNNPHALNSNQIDALNLIEKEISNCMVFSCSFSEEGDLLSQWRSYCPDAGGFAIGFNEDKLRQAICGYNAKQNIRKLESCIYGEEKLRQAKVIADGCLKGITLNFDKNPRDVFHNTLLEFMFYACRSKNDYFEEESEVRLYTAASGDLVIKSIKDDRGFLPIDYFSKEEIQFRTNSNIVIPYLIQTFPLDAIEEIVIGPTKNSSTAKQGLEVFLLTKGVLKVINIKKSSIPFRRF